jgi:hypothetical protein
MYWKPQGEKCDLISAYDLPAENPRLIETYHFSDPWLLASWNLTPNF